MKKSLFFLCALSGLASLGSITAIAASYPDIILADGPIAYFRFSDVPPVATNIGSLGPVADGTYLNGATTGAEAPRPPQFPGFEADNTALQLDGVNDFVRSQQRMLNSLTNVTVSGWVRRAGTQRNRTGVFGQDNLVEFGYINNNTLQLWVDNFETSVDVANPFPDAEWDHVALVADGNALRMTIYTNGLAAGSQPIPGNDFNSLNSSAFFVIGGDTFGNGGVSFNGQLDEVAVFDKALSAQKIANQYFSMVERPPLIIRQPQSTNVFEGTDVILSVEVVGTPPLTYQWLDFGFPIENQTNSTLVFSNITTSQGSSYQVQISNPFGDVLSDVAEVIVSPTVPPTITQEPSSMTRYAGGRATLTVSATGGSRLGYQWQKAEANITGATNSSLTFSNVQPTDAGDYRAIVSNAAGSVTSMVATITIILPVAGSHEAAVVQAGAMAFWRFNETEGTTAFDYAGGNDATYVNTATTGLEAPRSPEFPGFEAGNFALQLDGTSAYVTGPTGLLNGLSHFTMLGWIRRGADQANRTGLFGQNDVVEFGYINNNTLEVWTDNGLDIAPNPFPNGEWAQVAVVGDGSPGTLRMYTNGGLAGFRSHVLPVPSAYPFNIGGGGIFDVAGNFFNGQIDEVAVFDKALSGDQICSLFVKATGRPVSLGIRIGGNIVVDSKPVGTQHNGANFGAEWADSNMDGNFVTREGVMQFVATETDQITLAPDPDFNSSQGTIMFWMRSAGTAGGGDFAAILMDRRSDFSGDVITQTDSGEIFVQARDSGGSVNAFSSTRTVNDDRWHHIAYVYDQAGATTLYIDGVQAGSQVTSRPWSWDVAQQIELGRSHDGFWRAYNGAMDDFRIYNRMLTDIEIGRVVTLDDLVDTTALKVRFNFDAAPTGVSLSWLCGILQCTDTLVGSSWTDVPNAISPYVVYTQAAPNRFYRIRY
jgi:hypothetical protein